MHCPEWEKNSNSNLPKAPKAIAVGAQLILCLLALELCLLFFWSLGLVAKFRCTARSGAAGATLALTNVAPPYCRCKNTIHLKCGVRCVLSTNEYQLVSFTQVDLVLDKANLAGIVIHKCIPTHGIHFILKFCLQNPAPGASTWTLHLAKFQKLATGP